MNNTDTTVFISDADQYVFGQGTHYEIYKKLGSHFCKKGKKDGVFFAVWAPNAREVYVIGEFNDWSESASPMERLGEGGITGPVDLCHICRGCEGRADVQVHAGAP